MKKLISKFQAWQWWTASLLFPLGLSVLCGPDQKADWRLKDGRGALSILLIAGALSLYVTSLYLPALLVDGHPPVLGGEVLENGWLGLLCGSFAWCANQSFFVALIAYWANNMQAAAVSSVFAVTIGATSFLAQEWWYEEELMANIEFGVIPEHGSQITGLGQGFYVWMGSFAVLLFACLVSAFVQHRRKAKASVGAPVDGEGSVQ